MLTDKSRVENTTNKNQTRTSDNGKAEIPAEELVAAQEARAAQLRAVRQEGLSKQQQKDQEKEHANSLNL